MNEPQWDWAGGQEGSLWRNSEETVAFNLPDSFSGKAKIYETSSQNNLGYLGEFKISDEIKVAPRSVSTIIM